ncbi:hypothetical protein [Pseudomonas sp. F1002]|uniref:hypothetical protein n=1 Tax=Pseudomonas sp. F1002 TaxID=2738821 RepID=UPI0015A41D72|nr:hypothetical protein [Pseudomonas sp. F1002]NWB62372.1 hypothetical protein [Pseudomonas sp. F1002]
MSNKNIWYLPGPFHQYQEDVKALAKANGLRIVDASVTESREDAADNVPDVTVKEVPKVLLVGGGNSSVNIDAFRADLDAVNLLAEQLEAGFLDVPKGEGVALRVHKAVTALWVEMESLAGARNEAVDKAALLQKQVDGLLAQAEKTAQADAEAKEVADLKAKLDTANVTYRANASKESLQKQVDELAK